MLIKALLIAIWAGFCSLDDVGGQMLRRPLLTGTIAGFIMGDPAEGMIISATLELMWMGIGNVGAYQAPDIVAGAIIGTALGISTGGGVAAGIALAVPTSVLCQQLMVLYRSAACVLNPLSYKAAETGDFDALKKIVYLPGICYFLIRAIPCFLAVYFGDTAVQAVVDALPEVVTAGLSVASKIIPAVGIAILLQMMLKGRMWIFFFLGFILTTYLGLSIIPVAVIGLAFAVLYDMSSYKNENNEAAEVAEGAYDL